MTGRNVVCIAPTEWGVTWQRYHEIMRRLAALGNHVLIIDNLYRVLPSVPVSAEGAARLLGKAWRVIAQMRLRAVPVEQGIAVLAPPVFPGTPPWLAWPVLRLALRRTAQSLSEQRPIMWCAFPTPHIERLAAELRPALIVYDCAGAFADDPRVPPAVVAAERTLLRIADLVFTDSRTLWERHRRAHPRCYWIPTGVDATKFAISPQAGSRWPHPVVGYIGTLHAWLDTDLIAAVAHLRPQWRFVFVGPRRESASLERIASLPNVEFLGPRPHDALPDLIAQFSVAWIPYRITEFTRYVFPTKMLEYLAAAKPVVSTDLDEVRGFSPPVRIATGAAATAAALDEAMRVGSDLRGRELAITYDWSAQMAAVHYYLDTALRAASA